MSETSVRDLQSDRFRDDSRNNDDSIDLRGIIVTLRKFKWPIILTTALLTALTALVVSSMTPVYRSEATLLFDDQKQRGAFDPTFGSAVAQDIQTQVEVLKSRTLAERIVKELDLSQHWEYNSSIAVPVEFQNVGPFAPIKSKIMEFLPSAEVALTEAEAQAVDSKLLDDLTVRKLMGRTTVFPLKQTNLVKVSVEGVDRVLATKIANGIGSGYIQYYIDQSDSKNKERKEYLQGKVDELKVKLEGSEQQLLRARREVGIGGDGNSYVNATIAQFNSRLVDAKTVLETARIQWNEVQNAGGGSTQQIYFQEQGAENLPSYEYVGTSYELLPVVDSNPTVLRNKQVMQESKRLLDELLNRYGAKHPRVIDAQSNYETATRNLDRQIGNTISAVEKSFLAAQGQVRSLQTDIRREEGKADSISQGRVTTKEFELERDSNKQYYEDATSELRGYQEQNLQSVPMSVSDVAAIPQSPIRPKKTLMVMLGFLLSLFGISALLFAYESMKETVQGIHDVEKKLGVPVFGIIPVVRGGMFSKKTIPLIPGEFDDKRGAFAEAIRTIRTSATVSELEKSNQVIMVTSSVPAEGKSTLSSNLAYSLSQLENVVLIEADMRRPGLGRALGIRSHGLSELLAGDAYLEDCMRVNAIGELDIIPAGRIPETHLELLASPEFSELIDLLKERYDRIVIDLAPVQAVSDAIVVGKYADSAIYVVKADSTPLPVVKRGIERLREVGIDVTGAVISQVDLAKISSYGGDYYYQGYYDYYGYGENKNQEKKKKSLTRQEDSFASQSRAKEDRREAKKISHLKDRREWRDPSISDDHMA